jgi:geranylgeranyl diphosphate synthase type II
MASHLADRVEQALALVGPAADAYITTSARDADAIAPHAGELWRGLGSQFGGKLGRPRLTVAAYLGCGGDDLNHVIAVAVAQELLHTAMLVHDDLLDGDEFRRGRPNLAGSYRQAAQQQGYSVEDQEDVVQAAALLGGDLAIAAAMDVILESSLPPAEQTAVLSLLVRAIHTTVAGELLDVLAQGGPLVADPEYIGAYKTAYYTCQTPLVAGALVAGAPSTTRESLQAYGRHLGIAFQIADDYRGVFGQFQETGKSAISDLQRGKWTALLATAWKRANADQATVLAAGVGRRDLTATDAQAIREVFVAVGADVAARDAVAEHSAEARAALRQDVPAELATYLSAVADEIEESLS